MIAKYINHYSILSMLTAIDYNHREYNDNDNDNENNFIAM